MFEITMLATLCNVTVTDVMDMLDKIRDPPEFY